MKAVDPKNLGIYMVSRFFIFIEIAYNFIKF